MLDWFQSSAEGAKQDVENTPKWVLVPQASFGLVIYLCLCVCPRWQKLSEKFAEKVLTRTKILSPNIRYFVAIIRFVAIYALFGNLWAKKCLFGSKTVFLGKEGHFYMVYIAYFTELKSKIWDYAQKLRSCRENCKYALDENLHDHFCPPRKAAKFCHPGTQTVFLSWIFQN